MNEKAFSAATWLLAGLAIGVLLGRQWQGEIADSALTGIALLAIVVAALALVNAARQCRRIAPHPPAGTPEVIREPLLKRWTVVEFLILGLALAAIGQSILAVARDLLVVGIAAYASGLIVLLSLVRVARHKQSLSRVEVSTVEWLNRADKTSTLQGLLAFGAIVGIAISVLITQTPRPGGDYWLAFFVWLGALLALTVAFVIVPARPQLRSLAERMRRARVEIIIVVALTLGAFLLRTVDLTNIPYPVAGDEASVGWEGRRILSGEVSNMFITGWQSEPSMSFLPWAISMAVFGQNIFGLRLCAAMIGTLTIPLLYLLARSLFDRRIAALSAVLLTAMSTHIHFSRIAVNNITNAFFACLVFWLVYRAIQTRRLEWFAATGLTSGLAIYTFVGSRLVAILAGVILLYACATDRTMRSERRKIALAGLIAGLTVLPLAIYFLQHPDIAFGRFTDMGLIQSGWLEREMQQTGKSALSIFENQISAAFLVLCSTPAVRGFYNSPGALFDPLWSLFLILGIAFSILRLNELRHVIVQLWFWSVLLFAGILLMPPPFAERYVMAFPAIAIFIACGISNIISLIQLPTQRTIFARSLPAVAALALAATSLNFYFFEYTPHHYYADPNTEVGMELGSYLATVPRKSKVYFLGEPRMFYEFPSIPFLSNGLDGVDVPLNVDVRQLVEPGRTAIFVALPERQQDLEQIRRFYPGGDYWQVPRRTRPQETLYLAYSVFPQ